MRDLISIKKIARAGIDSSKIILPNPHIRGGEKPTPTHIAALLSALLDIVALLTTSISGHSPGNWSAVRQVWQKIQFYHFIRKYVQNVYIKKVSKFEFCFFKKISTTASFGRGNVSGLACNTGQQTHDILR